MPSIMLLSYVFNFKYLHIRKKIKEKCNLFIFSPFVNKIFVLPPFHISSNIHKKYANYKKGNNIMRYQCQSAFLCPSTYFFKRFKKEKGSSNVY